MICYRFPDQQTFRDLALATNYTYLDEETGTIRLMVSGASHAIDEVGTITRGGEWSYSEDASGNEVVTEITPPETLAGWHVNFIGDPPAEWDPYLTLVSSAHRVFAGGGAVAPDDETLAEVLA